MVNISQYHFAIFNCCWFSLWQEALYLPIKILISEILFFKGSSVIIAPLLFQRETANDMLKF